MTNKNYTDNRKVVTTNETTNENIMELKLYQGCISDVKET